jgi:DnaJ-class molecular chaperone
VGEAFTVLSDPKKKSRYDSGHDLEDDTGNMGGEGWRSAGGKGLKLLECNNKKVSLQRWLLLCAVSSTITKVLG